MSKIELSRFVMNKTRTGYEIEPGFFEAHNISNIGDAIEEECQRKGIIYDPRMGACFDYGKSKELIIVKETTTEVEVAIETASGLT